MKIKILAILAITTIAIFMAVKSIKTKTVEDPDPPVWPDAFQQSFDETFINPDKKHEVVNGILYYDAANNRSRLDRASGSYDLFCTSLQNVTTPCVNLVVDSKRYIYFPNKKSCCICCDAQHGCGILKRDWLNEAKYLGEDNLNDHKFQKWSKDGVVGYNYYWNTPDDNKIPRKIDQDGTHIFDFNIYSYKKRPQSSGLFVVPDYCKTWCPSQSFCGKFQNSSLTRADHGLII